MNEIEKRLGLDKKQSIALRDQLVAKFGEPKTMMRTFLIKVDNQNFLPDPNSLIDIKIKLINNKSIWSTKYGSWHADACRKEFEIHFYRTDLENVIETLHLHQYRYFVLFSTIRSAWKKDKLIYTLDEYKSLPKSLFEIEAENDGDEDLVLKAFDSLSLKPMDSIETISFINSLNQYPAVQIDLNLVSPKELAKQMIGNYLYAA